MKKFKFIICFSLTFIFMLYGCNIKGNSILNITFFDIGKADSILINIENKKILIDTGNDEDAEEIICHLKQEKIRTIDFLIITHFDKDHVGGADKILKELTIDSVITPNYESNSNEYNEFMDELNKTDATLIKLSSKKDIPLKTATCTIYPPEKNKYSEEDNDFSLVVSLIHGDNSFLFAGDSEEERLNELIENGHLEHTLLKVPHHGKYENNSENFFSLVNPKYAVITCSDKNLPDEEVIDRLKILGTQIYLTKNGTVLCSSNGSKITLTQK